VLSPGKDASGYDYDPESHEQRQSSVTGPGLVDTITYYQRAADLYAAKSRAAP
jgi:hypothetical protein